jgi:hypothetical protein
VSADIEGIMIELGAARDRVVRRAWRRRLRHQVRAVSHGHATRSADGTKLYLWAGEPVGRHHVRDVRVELDEQAVLRLLDAIADTA